MLDQLKNTETFFSNLAVIIFILLFACDTSKNGDTQKIVFISNRITSTDNHKICIIEPDGKSELVLTHDSLDCFFPQFSPDGSRILFFTFHPGSSEIYLMKCDGGNLRNLSQCVGEDNLAQFSPDGSQIVFVSQRDGNREIYIMNSDGAGQTRLTNNNYIDYSPMFSPDGRQLVFYSMIRRDSLSYDIFIMNTDGTGQKRLTQPRAFYRPFQVNDYTENTLDLTPRFSPDGKRIVFSAQLAPTTDPQIFMVDTSGENLIQLSDGSGQYNVAPCFSPDGGKIFFRTHRDDRFQIYSMNLDGTGQRNISNDMGHTYFCDFSENGERMVYYSNAEAYYDIYLMNLITGDKVRLTENSDLHDNLLPMFQHGKIGP